MDTKKQTKPLEAARAAELLEHSQMLGRICSVVQDDCDEDNTTLEGVEKILSERNFYKAAVRMASTHPRWRVAGITAEVAAAFVEKPEPF